MKTNSRKRLLVSSVAMLLVAMLALGTATYAWFTQDTTAFTKNLSVQTVKASELLLSKSTGDWTDQLDYATVDKILKPASSADGENWFSATAAAKTGYAADADTIAEITSMDAYVFADQLNVTNNGGAAVENVKIKFSLAEDEQVAGAAYLRVALVEVDKKGADATITGNFKAGVFSKYTDSAEALTSTAGATETVTSTAAGTGVEFSVGTLQPKDTTGSTKYYNLYVWFEGQDTDCKDANAGNSIPEITFTVSGDTVEQN
ncbi:hypothetical protein [Ruminococcus sp.]|uniref:hypothetical protein n=1 Tax=Ruminococcus sp. TaxID=41978 RepID=UPI003F0F4296